jgi:hypothetical protein
VTELSERTALARAAAADAGDLLPAHHPAALLAELERTGALTPTALFLPPDLSLERYEAICHLLRIVDSATRWWIGDALLTGEVLFGELAYQAIEALGLSEDTRLRYVNVAQRVPPPRRSAELSWSHHKHIAALEPTEQTKWLEDAKTEGWSSRELYEQLREKKPERPDPKSILTAARVLIAASVRRGAGYFVPADVFEAFVDATGGHP